MYWYKSNSSRALIITALLFTLFFAACQPDVKETGNEIKYFDLKAYFKGQVANLTAHNRAIAKTAIHNKTTETRKVNISNWERELNMFTDADINKPAWKDSYSVQNTGNTLIYMAKDPELEIREMIINKDKDKVKWILIYTHTKNILYETREKLTYIPDSLYQIQKSQHVKLMGNNFYDIKGILN